MNKRIAKKINTRRKKRKEQYETSLSQGAEYVAAPASGLVSYRVDGLENVLKIDSFGNFNKEFLEKLNLKTGQTVASSEEMGKVINNYYCYIIFNSSSNEAKEAKVGDEVQIRLQNSNITKGNIENIISEDDESRTITVKITKNVEELTAYRKISVDVIWWSYQNPLNSMAFYSQFLFRIKTVIMRLFL